MAIGNELAAALPRMQAMAESLMRDTVRVERITGVTTDPDPPFGVIETFEVAYLGKAKFQTGKTYETTNDVGESIRTSSRGELHVPHAAFVAEPGMRVTLIASLDSPGNVGAVVRLAEPMPGKTFRTSDRHNIGSEA